MNTKVLLALLLVSFTITSNAQETKSSCNFDYSIQANKNPDGLNYEDRYVNFRWNISKIASNDEISIEIIKIYDCFKAIEGNQLESYIFLHLKKEDFKDKNSFKIMHTDMLAKCFKWRVILKSDTCIEQSNWNYYSFLD